MKTKLLALMVVFTMLFAVFANIPVKAEDEVSEGDYSSISFENFDNWEESKRVYSEGETNNEALKGATYDKGTNTLTLDNVHTDFALYVNMMGNDFKLKVVGENDVAMISMYEGNLTITGDGVLNIDSTKLSYTTEEGDDETFNGISLYTENKTPILTIEDTVAVNIKSSDSVIKIIDTPNNDGSKAIILKNGQNISSNIKTEHYSYTIPIEVKCIELEDEGNPATFKIYTKDGRKYGVLQHGEQYEVRLKPIVYAEGLDKYFFEYTYEGDYNVIFDSEEQLLSAGYEATEEEIIIEGDIYPTENLKLKNKNGDEFVGFYYMDDENEFHFVVYDISDYEIKLSDGETYKIVTENTEYENALEEASPEDDLWLHVERTTVTEDNYNIFVNLNTLNIPAGTVEEEPAQEEPAEDTKVKVEAAENTTEDTLATAEVSKLINSIVEKDEGTVEGVDEELADLIREKVENGETIYVDVVTKEVKAADVEEDAKKVEEKVKDGKVASYFDIDIVIRTADETLGTVTALKDKIKVTIDIPKDLPAVASGYTRTYKVIRVHDGKAEELKTTVSGNKATFESDLFSTYALTYKDEKKVNNPATGDNIIVYFIALVVSIAGIAFAMKTIKNNKE